MHDQGRLIDRNAGAEVLANLGDLAKVCRENDRVWVVVNREKLRNRGRNIAWHYPGGRVELFLRKNLRLEHQTYLWSVFLWDAAEGRYEAFRGWQG